MSSELSADLIKVEVAYARPEKQHLLSLNVPAGSCAQQAIELSGILEQCPDIDLDVVKIGIWGKTTERNQKLKPRDRVEIYRPLKADPKEARRKRAKKEA